MRKLLATTAIVIGACWFWTPVAHATAITPASDITIDFTGTGSGPTAGITGTAVAELKGFTFGASSVTFQMDVTNTTVVPAGTNARLTAVGWVTAPASTTATDNTNIYATTTNVGLGPANLSICFFSGPNCNGGAGGGLEDPADATVANPVSTGVFDVTINFAAAVPPLDFSQFDMKFQTALGSFFASGTVVTPPPPPPPPPPAVPEPWSLALLGTGVLGLAAVRRRSA